MLPSYIIFCTIFLYTSVSFLDMVRHLLCLHYLYVISIVKAILKKACLKSQFFPRGSKKGKISMNRYN